MKDSKRIKVKREGDYFFLQGKEDEERDNVSFTRVFSAVHDLRTTVERTGSVLTFIRKSLQARSNIPGYDLDEYQMGGLAHILDEVQKSIGRCLDENMGVLVMAEHSQDD